MQTTKCECRNAGIITYTKCSCSESIPDRCLIQLLNHISLLLFEIVYGIWDIHLCISEQNLSYPLWAICSALKRACKTLKYLTEQWKTFFFDNFPFFQMFSVWHLVSISLHYISKCWHQIKASAVDVSLKKKYDSIKLFYCYWRST